MAVVSNGTTIIDAGSLGASIASGPMNLLSSQTASGSANISFTSGITSAYKEYVFSFHDIHPATDGAKFGFQFNASGGSGFDETLTGTPVSSHSIFTVAPETSIGGLYVLNSNSMSLNRPVFTAPDGWYSKGLVFKQKL